jgi:hypothetical protein
MGQEQSSLNRTKEELNSLYNKIQAERLVLEGRIQALLVELNKNTNDNWQNKSMKGYVILTKRADGSSVKELHIPDWNVAFYNTNEGISVRDFISDDTLRFSVTVNEEDAVLLHSLWIKSYHAKSISVLVQPILQHYINDNIIKV